jgi:hypothetical protein
MNAHRWILPGVAAALVAGAVYGRLGATATPPGRAGLVQIAEAAAPVADLPVLQIRRYRMAGRIRPLLFWIGRDDVGIGEIVWRGAEGAVAYELLIGTDASKAPRGINRWGYILEDSRPSGTRVLGVMTTSEEATLTDVRRQMNEGQRRGRFKAIDARIASGISRSATETIETDSELTVHDKAVLVRQVEERLSSVPQKETAVPSGVRPGFLSAVAELMSDTISARRAGATALRRMKGHTIAYVYGRNIFDLALTGVKSIPPPAATSAPNAWPVRASFEIRSRRTGAHYPFDLEYGTEGALAGVPTLIQYQPRWWLQAKLILNGGATPASGGAADIQLDHARATTRR